MLNKGLVESELLAATGVIRERGESDEDYRRRLILWTDDCLPACWDDLSSFTQEYYNHCVEVLTTDPQQDCPDFPVHPDDGVPNMCSGTTQTATETVVEAPAKETKKKAKAAKPAKDKQTPEVKRDEFGLSVKSLSHVAAQMFVKGAKMSDVKKETGNNHYNMLRKLEAKGHKIERKDGVITLTAKKE